MCKVAVHYLVPLRADLNLSQLVTISPKWVQVVLAVPPSPNWYQLALQSA